MNHKFDVIVAGGGPSGVNAAITAAQEGAKVLLVERYGFLGGAATAALVGPWMTFHDKNGTKVIEGIPEELVRRLKAKGASPGHVLDTTGYVSTVTPFDPELLKLVYLDFCLEVGVNLLFHTLVTGAVMNGNKIIGLEVANKSGKQEIYADVIIDATGDGDVAAFAGAEFKIGREDDNLTQPMTLMFVLGNVELQAVKDYMTHYPLEFHPDTQFNAINDAKHLSVNGFYRLLKQAQERGELDLGRNMVLFFQTNRVDQVTVNMTRATKVNATDAWELTQAEIVLRKQMWDLLRFFKEHVPGFEKTYLVTSGLQAGVRESRRITGDYTLNSDDIIQGVKFEDRICRNAYPIDIHDPDGVGVKTIYPEAETYYIPYRCLLPKGIESLLVVGRSVSCTHETLAAIRTQPSVMAIGQAGGVAAALSIKTGCEPRQIDVEQLQHLLGKRYVNL